jgi:hypothetical protein
MQTLRLATHHP